MDDARVIAATGKAPGEWFAVLDERGARDLPHKEIAALLRQEYGVPSWWSQMVTVEYEKHIGRRVTGQRQDGAHEATATKTVPGTMDEVLDRWLAQVPAAEQGFAGVPFAEEPGISRTDKWRYWRVALADGSRVMVSIADKPRAAARAPGPASTLAVTSAKLATRADADRWKAYWKAYLAAV